MSDKPITTEQMISAVECDITEYAPRAVSVCPGRRMKDAIIDRLTEYDALKVNLDEATGEIETWEDSFKRISKAHDALKADYEYKNEQLGAAILRAEKAEAELAEARPLLEAVMGAKLFPAPTDGRTCMDSHDKIIRAALAYRAAKEK